MKRILSMLLALLMVVGIMPVTAMAEEVNEIELEQQVQEEVSEEMVLESVETEEVVLDEEVNVPVVYNSGKGLTSVDYDEGREDDYYKLISKNDYQLAPGIVESEIVLNNAAGSHRQVAHVVEVDLSNEYTKVIPSYNGMKEALDAKKYSVEIMSKQAAYAEANGYGNVVAAMNLSLSWYDSAYYKEHPELVGEPLGYMVLDGEVYKNSQGQTSGAQTCVVINFDEKDGVARPADMPKVEIRSTSSAITGWEEQVIPANFGFLVKDGKNQSSKNHTSDPASRSFVGIKADGTFVMVMNDGRQSPYSAGFNSYEMAEFMLSLGCVYAVNGDGGGSSAFLSQRPGEELKVNCMPSDGAERETTGGILVISTAPVTGEFDRATISSEYDYYTPNSVVEFSAIGSDLVGTPAEIPADAAWQLADSSFGTIENGVFTSTGKEGAVTVQMVSGGEVVGEDTIYVVMPDAVAFAQENMVIPFGKTVEIVLNATYNNKPVCIKPADVKFELSNNVLGTINGFNFTAVPEGTEGVDPATITATIGALSVTANISLGKGTDIIYDFENQDLTGWSIFTNYGKYGPVGPNGKVTDDNGNYWYHGQNERGYISVVDSTTGKVRNGNYALKVECDFTQVFETGYQALNLIFPTIDTTDALAVGFWLYVPYDARHAQLGIAGGGFDNGELFKLNEGWHYVTAVPDTQENTFYYVNISVDDRACSSTGNYYDYITEPNLNGKYTFYIDDISVDYSSAVEDRENPVFEAPQVLSYTGETSAALEGQTVNYNNPTFEVRVADYAADNATGIKASSAKAYIDGKEVECNYANGKMSISGVVLADGVHTIKFEISDNAGNTIWAGGKVNIAAGTDASTVKVVPQDPEAYRPLIGSLYWMDVVATDIETIEKVEMVFDLNNGSQWELEGMTTAKGFTAEYSIQEDDNIATIVITRTGKNTESGEAVLASFPVRTWESHLTEYEGYEEKTPKWLVNYGAIWKTAIELDLQRGVITYVPSYEDATNGTFGMDDLVVDTEIFFTNYTRKSVEGAQEWINAKKAAGTGWHEHTVTALEDKAADCDEHGYTGRTYCEVCESVVDWGTKVEATGHSYEFVDGKLVCSCGETCTELGLVEANGKYYYNTTSGLLSGWVQIGEDHYYFSKTDYAGYEGEKTTDSHIKYEFEGGRVTKPVWETTEDGIRCWYGPASYRDTTNDTKSSKPVEIDGKTYLFNRQGYLQVNKIAYSFQATADLVYYYCDEEGVATLLNGVNDGYLYIAGVLQRRYQLVEFEGNFYFVNDGNKIAKNVTLYLSEKFVEGKTFADGRAIQVGRYEFDAEGKMVVPELKHGVVDDILYINDVKQVRYQLVEFEGNFYFINDGDKIAKNTNLYLSTQFVEGKTFPDGRAIQVGTYEFDENGRMVIPEQKHGIVDDRLYINDVVQKAYQLVEFEGNFYFINDGMNRIAKNTKLYLSEKFVSGKTFPDGRAIQPGTYYFDAEGKMDIPELKHGVVNDILYINDVVQKAYQLVEFEGNFYFVNDGDKVAKNTKLYLSEKFVSGKTFADGRAIQPGIYYFDAEGKMEIPEIKHGIIDGKLYINDVLQARYQLVEFEGNFYFVNDGDKVATNVKLYLSEKFVSGKTFADGTPIPAGYYRFDAEGKMIIE